jgi:hypothetical protein
VRGGGTCFGDSGGPVIPNGTIVAVTSDGYTDNCRYLGGYQRVDIGVVQTRLTSVGALSGRQRGRIGPGSGPTRPSTGGRWTPAPKISVAVTGRHRP